jgi:hypothetical protein
MVRLALLGGASFDAPDAVRGVDGSLRAISIESISSALLRIFLLPSLDCAAPATTIVSRKEGVVAVTVTR